MANDLIHQLEAFDDAFSLNLHKVLQSHQPFASSQTLQSLEKSGSPNDFHQINALIAAFAFLSWPLNEKYYDSKDTQNVLKRYCTMYGSKTELLNLLLNRFRESLMLGEYLHLTFLKKKLLELEIGFSLIAFQVLILDQIQQYHHFLCSLNDEKVMAKKIKTEILQRNKELNHFFQNSEKELKGLVAISMGKIPEISIQ